MARMLLLSLHDGTRPVQAYLIIIRDEQPWSYDPKGVNRILLGTVRSKVREEA